MDHGLASMEKQLDRLIKLGEATNAKLDKLIDLKRGVVRL